MRILKFVSKISLNLAELINSGIVSYIVTKVAENTEDDKKVNKNIKDRANVHNTSAHNVNNSDEHTRKDSSDKMALHITLKDCNVYINTPPEKE